MTKRPQFVTILSLWLMLGGLLSPLFLIGSANSELADRLAAQPDMGLWSLVAQHSGALGVALFGMALMLVPGVVGFGLWRMRTWARTAIIVIAAIDVLWGADAVIRTFLRRTTFDFGAAIGLAIFGFILYYFERRNVKQLFQGQKVLV